MTGQLKMMRMNLQVNKYNQRDEMRIDRLSSFLYHKGQLDCIKITPIKAHVFHISTPQKNHYILKKHPKLKVLQQQWDFFDAIDSPVVVPFTRFPNGQKFIKHDNSLWTIAPFVRGEKLHYSIERDRQESVATLRRFHQDAMSVNIRHPLERTLFYVRWSHRLARFKKTERCFMENGYSTLFRDIVKTTELQLSFISHFDWRKLEQSTAKRPEWIHGDVAGHNFIRGSGVRMIDFDLLACSPALYDYIQLGQRFLPYLEWDLDKLLVYEMVGEKELKLWIHAMLVPTDVLREWLHYLGSNAGESMKDYLRRMENDWLKRRYFLKTAKLMLKST